MAGSMVKRHVEAYIRRRTPISVPPLTVSRRRLYILPTASGLLFAVLLIVMVLGATNYGNNLAFALTFWLGAAALVSMHRTHRNLAGASVKQVSATPVFAGQTVQFKLVLSSRARSTRYAVQVSASGSRAMPLPVNITPDGATPVDLTVAAVRRGYQRCPMVRLDTVYPMGLFRAWAQLVPDVSVLIYPHPAGIQAWPTEHTTPGGRSSLSLSGGDEFLAHRLYHSGDSPRRIDWKASARSMSLMVTQHADTADPTHWFDFDALTGLDTEARLSQLALWVVNAANAGHEYGLSLRSQSIGPASGAQHRDTCLKALALH